VGVDVDFDVVFDGDGDVNGAIRWARRRSDGIT
jgi:hypothetical protein